LKTGGFGIRNCRVTDLRSIQRIENASFDDPYTPKIFWGLYLGRNTIFRTAFFQDIMAGYSVSKVETKNGETIAHLISLAVDPILRKKGIGSKLLEDAILQSKNIYGMCKLMELEVRTENKSAIALYEKFGFRQSQLIRNYYGRGKDALVMELNYT
jgi:[ribosomal protein S18]-alanine N-acetyltransferase